MTPAVEDTAVSLAQPVICIVGPTASGKSDVAQLLAKELGGEVVSADSMQIYRGMDIGTGKVLPEERIVAHHGLDLVDPGAPYSAALFQEYARSCFHSLERQGKRSVLAGGTGLYVRAAVDAYDFPSGEQVENPVRERYQAYADEHGALALWELLQSRDPESADVLHPNNVRRVIRAFELLELEGTNYATQKRKLASIPQALPVLMFGMQVDPELLKERINRRVDRMIEAGLVQEVEGLLEAGFREGLTAQQAIGYKEIVRALDGEIALDEAVEDIKLATRRYAKRQRTWFRKDERICWINADAGNAQESCEKILAIIEKAGR